MLTSVLYTFIVFNVVNPTERIKHLLPSGSTLTSNEKSLFFIIIIIFFLIKNEKIKVTLCENAAGALYIHREP